MVTVMRAVVRGRGRVELRTMPRPELVGKTDVLVRVHTAGICRTDLMAADGTIPVTAPRVLGHEASGTVEDAADGVQGLAPGAAVTFVPRLDCGDCDGCRRAAACWAPRFLGLHADGVFADWVRVPARAVLRIPETLSFRLAAYVEPVAAALAVVETGIAPSERGLVHGDNRIAGLVLRVLRAKGFERVDVCAAGAPLPRNAYDFAIETGSSVQVLRELVPSVRPGGRIVLKSRLVEPVELVLADVVAKDLTLAARGYGSFDDAAALLASGALAVEPLLGASHPLESFDDVFREARGSESKKLFFRLSPSAEDD